MERITSWRNAPKWTRRSEIIMKLRILTKCMRKNHNSSNNNNKEEDYVFKQKKPSRKVFGKVRLPLHNVKHWPKQVNILHFHFSKFIVVSWGSQWKVACFLFWVFGSELLFFVVLETVVDMERATTKLINVLASVDIQELIVRLVSEFISWI